jgi:hypothetical protein
VSPKPLQRLKPYFKPRPRARAAATPAQPPTGQPPPASAPAASPQTQQPPEPQQAPTQQQQQTTPQPATPAQPPASADGAELRARRERLARRYAELQSDLGGLVYEMAIRDSFRLEVVVRRAAELQVVDRELSAVEQQLGIAAPPAAAACPSCGAPVQLGAQFCQRCGSGIRSTAPASAAPPSRGAPSQVSR